MSAAETQAEGAGHRKGIKLLGGLGVVAALVAAVVLLPVGEGLASAIAWVEDLGPWGPLAFVGLYVLVCVLALPGAIPTLGAGAVFGVWQGSLLVSVGSTIGATAAFLIGRYLARDAVSRKIAGSRGFSAIDRAVQDEGFKIVALTRLSPLFPFNVLNYAYGVTGVGLKPYVLGSWLGMIPGTVMYVSIGSVVGLAVEDRERSTTEWVLFGVGLLATVAVTVVVTKVARKHLESRVDLSEEQPS